MVQPHLVGSELLTYLNTQQQIQALEIEVTVRAAAAEADAIRARAALTQAEQALRRMRALREQNAKSARELEEAEFAQRKAEADLTAAEALKKTYDQAKKQLAERPRAARAAEWAYRPWPCTPPSPGSSWRSSHRRGACADRMRPVFTILNTETVLIEAQLPEVRPGAPRAVLPGHLRNPCRTRHLCAASSATGGRASGLRSGPRSMPKPAPCPWCTRCPTLTGHLRIGMALTVYVETAHVAEALAVPVSALVEEDGTGRGLRASLRRDLSKTGSHPGHSGRRLRPGPRRALRRRAGGHQGRLCDSPGVRLDHHSRPWPCALRGAPRDRSGDSLVTPQPGGGPRRRARADTPGHLYRAARCPWMCFQT